MCYRLKYTGKQVDDLLEKASKSAAGTDYSEEFLEACEDIFGAQKVTFPFNVGKAGTDAGYTNLAGNFGFKLGKTYSVSIEVTDSDGEVQTGAQQAECVSLSSINIDSIGIMFDFRSPSTSGITIRGGLALAENYHVLTIAPPTYERSNGNAFAMSIEGSATCKVTGITEVNA